MAATTTSWTISARIASVDGVVEVTGTVPNPRVAANALMDVGRYDDAARLLGEAVARQPQDSGVWCDLALCENRRGRQPEALDAAERAMGVDPQSEWAHRLRAHILLAIGEPWALKQALVSSSESIRLMPDSAMAWTVHSRVLRASNQNGPAAEAAHRAIIVDPAYIGGHEAFGLAMFAMNRLDLAEQAFRHILEIDPVSASAINNLGRVYLKQGNGKDAAALFARAAALDPTEPAYRRNAGLAAHKITRASVPIATICLLAIVFGGVGGGVLLVLGIGGLLGVAAYNRYRLRRGHIVASDGQPLPSGVSDALRDFERSRHTVTALVPTLLMLSGGVLMFLSLASPTRSGAGQSGMKSGVLIVGFLFALGGFGIAVHRRFRTGALRWSDPRVRWAAVIVGGGVAMGAGVVFEVAILLAVGWLAIIVGGIANLVSRGRGGRSTRPR